MKTMGNSCKCNSCNHGGGKSCVEYYQRSI